MRALEEKENRAQSPFEREVMKRLQAAGYRVLPQWRVGAFRIDLVVEGDRRRVAIECDGDRYHPLEKIPEDMERQAVLERMGWVFTRVRGTDFLRNPDRAMKQVFEKLEVLEIFPVNAKKDSAKTVRPTDDLTERVIRRAEELRREWAGPEPATSRGKEAAQAAGKAAVS